jgi:multicomponent Na+:H+ antiporter subunit B
MNSLILKTATELLHPLLLVFSVFLLFRGHDEPGGGFTGGLVAAAAIILHSVAHGLRTARATLRIEPRALMSAGLLLAAASGLVGVAVEGAPFLTGRWYAVSLAWIGSMEVGTPLFFDVGVYLVVVGFTVTVVFALKEE